MIPSLYARRLERGFLHAKKRVPSSQVLEIARQIHHYLKPSVDRIEIAGSIRRGEPPKDVDILVIGDRDLIYELMEDIGEPIRVGDKILSYLVDGVQVDIYFTTPKSWGAALFFLTGPAGYGIGYRRIAKRKGLLLNQYGLFDRKTGKYIAGRTEKSIYEALGKSYKRPELRGK